MIKSLLDIDMYKLLMMDNFYNKGFFDEAEYKFFNRKDIDLKPVFKDIQTNIQKLGKLKLTNDEFEYLDSLNKFTPDFLNFLLTFRLNPNENVSYDGEQIFFKGNILEVTLYEIYVLAIISELYSKSKIEKFDENKALKKLNGKIKKLKKYSGAIKITEFGTRRRFSQEWQSKVVSELVKHPSIFEGTSNVLLAMKHDLIPLGTMAHEYVTAYQSISNVFDSDYTALVNWDLCDYKIALTDTLTTNHFLDVFDKSLANDFDGVRHDSGDPFVWGKKILSHYETLNIDTKEKKLIFSDGLDVDTIIKIHKEFGSKCQLGFGIGTNLTNDVGLKESLNIVIKLTYVNKHPVIKLSDVEGKLMCEDDNYKKYVVSYFEREYNAR